MMDDMDPEGWEFDGEVHLKEEIKRVINDLDTTRTRNDEYKTNLNNVGRLIIGLKTQVSEINECKERFKKAKEDIVKLEIHIEEGKRLLIV